MIAAAVGSHEGADEAAAAAVVVMVDKAAVAQMGSGDSVAKRGWGHSTGGLQRLHIFS